MADNTHQQRPTWRASSAYGLCFVHVPEQQNPDFLTSIALHSALEHLEQNLHQFSYSTVSTGSALAFAHRRGASGPLRGLPLGSVGFQCIVDVEVLGRPAL